MHTARRFALARMIGTLGLVAVATITASVASAADYPTKAVTLIVPFPPGGTADAQARLVAKALSPRLGKPVVVDNRPGAGGRIGTDAAARALPDGHTLLVGSISTLAIEPALRGATAYDPQRDFAPLTIATEMLFVLVANPNIPARNLPELIQYGRKSDDLTYATWGVGTSSHLAAELFKKAADVRMTHVPYKGAVAAMTDMIGGRVSLMFGLPVDVISHVKAGKLRALAVTGQKRLPMLPDVPTFIEAGVPDVELRVWFGFVVPARTPPEIRQRLHTELVASITAKEFTDWAEGQGVSVVASPSEALALRIKTDSALAAKLAKSLDLKPDD